MGDLTYLLPGRGPAEGPLRAVTVDPAKLEQAQQEYFRMLGWDEAGLPTREALAELGIAWAAEHLKTAP